MFLNLFKLLSPFISHRDKTLRVSWHIVSFHSGGLICAGASLRSTRLIRRNGVGKFIPFEERTLN